MVNGSVCVTYYSDFRVTSQSVNGGNTVGFSYDNDGLLTQAGNLTISRNAQNGLLNGTSLGNVTTNYTYNELGEITNYNAQYNGSDIFSASYVMDDIGRITQITETVLGHTKVFDYHYDITGRLIQVGHRCRCRFPV